MYIKKSIYILQYPKSERASVSYGIIKDMQNFDIFHLCCKEKGSSGSPILNITTNKVIGIHNCSYNKNNFNKGTILTFSIKEFILKYFNKKKKLKNVTLINNIEIDFNPDNCSINYLKKYFYRIYFNCLFIEGFQIFQFRNNKLIGALEGPLNTSYESGFFFLK